MDNDNCLNGAECRDKDNDYECICAPGWQGRHCETSLCFLYSVACENGKTLFSSDDAVARGSTLASVLYFLRSIAGIFSEYNNLF